MQNILFREIHELYMDNIKLQTAIPTTDRKPLIISGPCSIETQQQLLTTCRQLAATGRVNIFRAGVWKPRTTPGCFEGVGDIGLDWLSEAKAETGLPTMVEVANAKHVESALKSGVDYLWIGARTTVSPFSVQEIADALRGVDIPTFVKNPMHADLALWIGAVQRLQSAGMTRIGLIHRGFSHYSTTQYRNSPMWNLAIEMQTQMPEIPIICDPSHIAGNRELLLEVAQKAADLNYDGLMIESHFDPDSALSDAQQQITPKELTKLLTQINWRRVDHEQPEFNQALDALRIQIDQYDVELFAILSERMKISEQIGEIKRDSGVTILQPVRWDDVVNKIVKRVEDLGLSREFVVTLLNAIHMESISRQNQIMNKKRE